MTNIFLSYSHADILQAQHLYHSLCNHGLSVWFDKESLLPGQTWEEEIDQEIRRSDFVILLLSKKSIGTQGFFQKEIRLALDVLDTIPFGHVYLLPVRVEECEIPSRLKSIQYVDLFSEWDRHFAKLLKSIEIYSEVRLRAKAAQSEPEQASATRVLMVNDQPATMNFVADLWKSCGVTIDYAFDVPQAINSLRQSYYDAVISDLSHFSPAGLVTDRAAFEILEWARDSGKNIKVIISTANVSAERKKLAQELGAIGICNRIQDLNTFLESATGTHIDYSPEFASIESDEPSKELLPDKINTSLSAEKGLLDEEVLERHRVYIGCSRADIQFAKRLESDLNNHGIETMFYLPTIATGQTWSSPTKQMIQESDFMLAIISRDSVKNQWLEREIYEGIAREREIRKVFVIPLVIDDEAVKNMPLFIKDRIYTDFRRDYETGLKNLLQGLNANNPKNGG